MSLARFRTSKLIWVIASCCLFSLLAGVDFTRGATDKDDLSFWSSLGLLLRMPNNVSAFSVAIFGLILALLSALFGWVIQASIAVACGVRANRQTSLAPARRPTRN
jgi:hypothetical protein